MTGRFVFDNCAVESDRVTLAENVLMIERDDRTTEQPTYDVRKRIELGDHEVRCKIRHVIERNASIAMKCP